MPVTMNFDRVMDRFSSPLPIYVDDMVGTYDNPDRPGEWVWSEPVRRVMADGETPKRLKAIMLALTVQTLYFYKEANVSEGGIALITKELLYYSNLNNEPAEQDKQSIVEYQNLKFRVVGEGFTSGSGYESLAGNANFHCYHALRYVA